MKRICRLFIGRYRLLFGFCPKCNSDAPAIDSCKVCWGYRWGGFGPFPNKALRQAWWANFKSFLTGNAAKEGEE